MAEKKEKQYVSDNAQLMAEWDWEKNNELGFDPNKLTCGSEIKIWWKCKLGHSFEKQINKMCENLSCPLCSGHKTVAGINDFATYYPKIAKEWHPVKNGDLTPLDISKKNGRKVWWICQYGHEWQATPRDRANGTGCPICSSRRLTSFPEQAIYYYVKKLYPDAVNRCKNIFENGMELDIYIPSIKLAIEFDGAHWHDNEEVHRREKEKYTLCRDKNIFLIRIRERTKNDWKDIADTLYIIEKRKGDQLSKVIQAILDSIDRSSNMWTRKKPYCFHSSVDVNLDRDENEIRGFLTAIPNSLVELRPDLAEEWHPVKNGKLTPNMFGINSNDYAWWKCKACGHEWRTTVILRGGKRNRGCPECSKITRGKTFTKIKVTERGSLAEHNSKLVKEWHPTKNGELTPYNITYKRFKNVWWLCPKCGHEWEASPNNRSKGGGCPCCSGRVPKIGTNDFQTLFPNIAAEWDFEKNSPYSPSEFLPYSGKKMWWKCKNCGFEWNTEIRSRSNGHGCPECAKQKRKKKDT
ncbi:MAG: zinc-ribbon domain-containing protein [Clostridia bacterium]|nr:zinc-ribbon domain-containing protein [Clostridia bacterium]